MADEKIAVDLEVNIDKSAESAIQLGETIAKGFKGASAAAALFGTQSKSLNSALEKIELTTRAIQGAQTVVNTVTEVGNILSLAGLKAQTKETESLTTATTMQTVATNVGTVASKGLRAAMAASGVGLLVIAVAGLVKNFDSVVETVSALTSKFNFFNTIINATRDFLSKITFGLIDSSDTVALNKKIEKLEGARDATKSWSEHEEQRIRLLKTTAGADKVYEAEKNMLLKNMDAVDAIIKSLQKKATLTDEEAEKLNKLTLEYEGMQADLAELDKAEEDRKAQKQKDDDEKAKQKREKAIADAKKVAEENKKIREQYEQDEVRSQRSNKENELADLKSKTDAYIKAGGDKTKAQENFEKEKKAITDKYAAQEQSKAFELEKKIEQGRIDLMAEGLDKERAQAELRYKDALASAGKNAELQKQAEEKLQKELSGIDQKYKDSKAAQDRKNMEDDRKEAFDFYDSLTEKKKKELQKQLGDGAKFKVESEKLDLQNLENKRQFLEASGQSTIEIEQKIADAKLQIEKDNEERIKNLVIDRVQKGIDVANKALEIGATLAEARKNKEMKSLDEETKNRLKAAGNDAKAREAIMKDYEAKKKAIDKEAFERDKKRQVAAAIINGLTALTKIAAEVPFPASIAVAALQIAMTAATVAKIRSTNFESGNFEAPATGVGTAGVSQAAPDVSGDSQRTTFQEAERRRQLGQKEQIIVQAIVPATVMSDRQNENEVIYQRSARRVR